MIMWIENINAVNGEKIGWLGLDDGCPLYKVDKDENGWFYEYLPDGDGMDGYATCEEAKAAADEDWEINFAPADWSDWDDLLFPIEEDDEYWANQDLLYEAARDERMLGE